MTSSQVKILCLGDVVGKPGRTVLRERLQDIKQQNDIDFVIINGENAAGGLGIDPGCADEIFQAGADVITLGDHTWKKKEIGPYFKSQKRCIRPANFPPGAPGEGYYVAEHNQVKIGIFNILGRVFMGIQLDCPFRCADQILNGPLKDCAIIVCDFHAEATSEKIAMGRYLDGRASLVFGTHTHVQTADEQILPGGTAYISDLGMTGSTMGVLGMSAEVALKRFLTSLPEGYRLATGAPYLKGIITSIDSQTGRAIYVNRISIGDV
jgi:metallophosphoesterase (TIGR00282 family)